MDFKTEFKPLTVQPQEIEGISFNMIDSEFGEHNFTEEQYKVVQRVVHASADFELGNSMLFHTKQFKQVFRQFVMENKYMPMYK